MNTKSESNLVVASEIQSKILTIRGLKVMLDRDLALIYGVKSIRLREQVKRNLFRFPEDFRFQLSEKEVDSLVSQNAIPSRRNLGDSFPYAFTEQGVAMLSAVLRSETAVKVSIQIMQAFVKMRHFMVENSELFSRIERVEQKQIVTDTKIEKIFNALDNGEVRPKQGIFFDGQIFDAYKLLSEILAKAEK